MRRYANLYFVWLVTILWVFFATVGYDLYSWALLLCPYFAAFDCLSSFKDGASELYRPPSGKKKTTSPQTSTASQWKTILPSKSLPRHNANPFYIQNSQGDITLRSKMATALQRPPLCNENQNGHRTTLVHSIITSAQ